MNINIKKVINKVFLPLFISVLVGAISGTVVYGIYKEKAESIINSSMVYLLEYGEYMSISGMNATTVSNNADYLYLTDKGIYKKIVGITKDKDNIDKIKEIYDEDTIVREYYLEDDELNNKILEYDKLLNKAVNKEDIIKVVEDILTLYKESDDIKLTKN